VVGIFAINYDITIMKAMEEQLHLFTATESTENEPQTIIHNVNDLLEELIKQSVKLVGKPAALMNKEDKVKAIRFLNDSGAFLITKSGQRVCNFFGISKYTLYTYIDEAKGEKDK
jgi:predicted transcriptional regulator YheO